MHVATYTYVYMYVRVAYVQRFYEATGMTVNDFLICWGDCQGVDKFREAVLARSVDLVRQFNNVVPMMGPLHMEMTLIDSLQQLLVGSGTFEVRVL